MSSWYSSWFPALPSINFALPSSIQRRFISFVLNKSLGHLLKPGQLDVDQIDSQIGSGYVQVTNLELDNQAANRLLSGLPVKMHSGSISSATVRMPWPNSLTSSLGVSLDTLHLTFHFLPESFSTQGYDNDLTESVTSIAESFIHDELTPREEATLRESFHPELASSMHPTTDEHHVPGSLDPFLSAPEDEQFHADIDPAGVSIFAGLIERLLAQFELDAVNTNITLIHPNHTKFTVSIPAIRYRTEVKVFGDHRDPQQEDQPPLGEIRTVSISGLTIAACDLRPSEHVLASPLPATLTMPSPVSPNTPSPSRLTPDSPHRSPSSVSPTSSSSSLNDDAQFMMSQSLAFLPPLSSFPTSSPASSMYQSAISTAPVSNIERPRSPVSNPSRSNTPSYDHGRRDQASGLSEPSLEPKTRQDELVSEDDLIFSSGTEPILIQLSTPPPGRLQPGESEKGSSPEVPLLHAPEGTTNSSGETLHLSVTAGIMAYSLRSWHMRRVLDLMDSWQLSYRPKTGSVPQTQSDVDPSSMSIFGLGLEVSLKVRGVVALALPSLSGTKTTENNADVLTGFFTRPLVPPRLPYGYVRLHLETISASLLWNASTSSNTFEPAGSRTHGCAQPTKGALTSFEFSLGELSLFAFHHTFPLSGGPDHGFSASPLLITDHHLPTQYPPSHFHPENRVKPEQYQGLPVFDVIDWTDEKQQRNGMKISLWRSKLKHKHGKHRHSRHDSQDKAVPVPSSVDEVNSEQADDGRSTHSSLPPAVLVASRRVISPSSKREKDSPATEVEVKVVPLHLFVDLGQALSEDGTLAYLDEIVGPVVSTGAADGQSRTAEEDSDEEGADSGDEQSTPATPRIYHFRERQSEREKERLRLEKLALEDLNLDLDYQTKESKEAQYHEFKTGPTRKRRTRRRARQSNVLIKLPMIRLQVRCPCPPGHSRRSGALVVDLHDIKLSTAPATDKPRPTFAALDRQLPLTTLPEVSIENALLGVDCRRIVIAYSLAGEFKATAAFSIGSLNPERDVSDAPYSGTALPPLPSRMFLIRSSHMSNSSPSLSTKLALTVDIPSVHINISKSVLDGLQYWADDAAQLVERISGSTAGDADTEKGRDTSLIGSRFFTKSRSGSGSGLSARREETSGETVVKLAIVDAFVRLMLPREHEGISNIRPFDIVVSDTDILMEWKPEGKDETVITFGIMDLSVTDTTVSGLMKSYLFPSKPRSLSSVPQSLLKLRFTSLIVPETTAKETKIKLTLCDFTYDGYPNIGLASDLGEFFKAPAGVFESVIPSESTQIRLKVMRSSIRALAPDHPGAMVFYVGDMDFSTEIVGDSPDSFFRLSVPTLALLFIDDCSDYPTDEEGLKNNREGVSYWKGLGYALLAEIVCLDVDYKNGNDAKISDTRVVIDHVDLRLHLCADSLAAVTAFVNDLSSVFKPSANERISSKSKQQPTVISEQPSSKRGIMSSVDEHAFTQVPEVGPAPDMINDDLPTNLDYLDESFGAAAGLRELRDDDLDEFEVGETINDMRSAIRDAHQTGIISNVGGETIKILRPEGIRFVENYFDTLPPDATHQTAEFGTTTLQIRVHNADVVLFLYDGYDWAKTRKTIEAHVKEMRRRLAKIRQLVASGQRQDPSMEETGAVLFNSIYVGLEQDADVLEPGAFIAAIDEELKDDIDTASQSSWQSLGPAAAGMPRTKSTRFRGKRLTRSMGPNIEFRLLSVEGEVDLYRPDEPTASRILTTVRDLEILDHIKTSTWKKFLTELHSDSRGNVRETDSNMVRVELRNVRPVPNHPSEEARFRAKLLPLRLYVDQDALDFLKNFFSFKDANDVSTSTAASDDRDIYFQLAEIFPVELKLDYKPRRVNYRALREGRTIELMNFFHFDGAEMTLRHITLNGITGWSRLFDMLNDLWTPDVKATQLVDVISGVSPIRSVVNVGSGVADLVLLPITQYKKDGRIVRGVQKGTTAFVKSTAMEAIKLGARLATGTQVILEQAEGVLGSQFKDPVTTEAVQVPAPGDDTRDEFDGSEKGETLEIFSKYAQQPTDIKEGMQFAYRSLQRNFNSAAQTILAVPMEVYERSGSEGPVRSVIRAVPIAVLKPMIGASEAVSKTLLGLHNTLDPNIRHENEAKYKHR